MKQRMNNDDDKSETLSIKAHVIQYLKETGCHGCHNIGQNNRLRGTLWVIFILSSFAYLLRNIVNDLNDYYNYPSYTKSSYEIQDIVPFPAVTVCNACPLSKIGSSVTIKSDPMTGRINWRDPSLKSSGVFNPQTEDNLFKDAHPKDTFFQSVFMDKQEVNITETITRTVTNMGPCFTFNSGGKTTTSSYGTGENLEMLLFINQSDYFLRCQSAGVKVLVYDPDYFPDLQNSGVNIPPGVHAYLKISEVETEFLPYPFLNSNSKYCKKSDTIPKYTKKRCIEECVAYESYRECGCRLLHDPIDGVVCSLYQELTCNVRYKKSLRNQGKEFEDQCGCSLSCNYREFETSLDMLQFPSNEYSNQLEKIYGMPLQSIRENYLKLNIYFGNLRKRKVIEVAKYSSVSDVLANIGGQMGLFLGASILTVLELLEFILFVIHIGVVNMKRQRDVKMPVKISVKPMSSEDHNQNPTKRNKL